MPERRRHNNIFEQARNILTTLQLRIDLWHKTHFCADRDEFLAKVEADFKKLSDLFKERRAKPREPFDDGRPPGM